MYILLYFILIRDTKVRLGPLDMGDWYDFWVRAETRVGQGPASSIATILAQNSGNNRFKCYRSHNQ